LLKINGRRKKTHLGKKEKGCFGSGGNDETALTHCLFFFFA
jgi:hypothetical protein